MERLNKEVSELTPDTEEEEKVLSPSEYFDYVKGMKQKSSSKSCKNLSDICLKLIEKFKITGQADAAKLATETYETLLREQKLIDKGFDTYVHLDDVTKYIKQISDKAVKIIDLEHFPREIPDNVVEKYLEAKELFDKMYVVFTDYTEDESSTTSAAANGKKNVVKEVKDRRKEKDPILFGALKVNQSNPSMKRNTYEKLFFIADWVDNYCDLTFDKIIKDMEKKGFHTQEKLVPVETLEEFKERSHQ